jgi:hypothetical protein
MVANRMGGMARRVGTLFLMTVICLLAANKFPGYPPREVGDCAISTQSAGITMGVQPVEDFEEQKLYFGFPPGLQSLIPVYIVIHNGSSGDTFLFDVKTAASAFVFENAAKPVPFFELVRENGGPASPGPVAGNNVYQNMLKKSLQSGTLAPGASVRGFLYIPGPAVQVKTFRSGINKLTKRYTPSPRPKIRFDASLTRSGTDETVTLEAIF